MARLRAWNFIRRERCPTAHGKRRSVHLTAYRLYSPSLVIFYLYFFSGCKLARSMPAVTSQSPQYRNKRPHNNNDSALLLAHLERNLQAAAPHPEGHRVHVHVGPFRVLPPLVARRKKRLHHLLLVHASQPHARPSVAVLRATRVSNGGGTGRRGKDGLSPPELRGAFVLE